MTTTVSDPTTAFEAAKEEAPLTCARDIMLHLEEADGLDLPLVLEKNGQRIFLDYDETVEMIEGLIRHYFGLEPRNESSPFRE